jgi:hypothetical protein
LSGADRKITEIFVYQRALALIAALLAAHCAWSVMSADDTSVSDAVLAKIATIAPARIIGLRPALPSRALEAAAAGTLEDLAPSPRRALVASQTPAHRPGDLTINASWAP